MTGNGTKQIVEALIFASDKPISVKTICQIVDDLTEQEVQEIISDLEKGIEDSDRGIILKNVAGGYEFVTAPQYAVWVQKLMSDKKRSRLSRAGLELAAIVAYRQPIIRAEIEKIRGVDCGAPLRTLLERNLIKIAGREKAQGRPLIYATTDEFLHYFGINSLVDLPKLEEIEEIMYHDAEKAGLSIEQLSFSSRNSSPEEERQAD